MTRVTALIAEDELPQREELRGMLSRLWPQLEIVGKCSDGLAALEAIESLRPGIVLLDIRMPGGGRLTLRLRGRPDKLPVSSALQHRFRGM